MPQTEHQDIEALLRKYGLEGPYPQWEYVHTVEKRFGKDGLRFMNSVDDALAKGFTAEAWQKIYRQKNKKAEMSAYISAHCNTEIYRCFLQWLQASDLHAPRSFMELGCENGLLTLCLADLWPQAEAAGLDSIGNAIKAARTLARSHRKSRVIFHQADLAVQGACHGVPTSEYVLAPFVFHELMEAPTAHWQHILANLDGLLAPDGCLIALSRFPYPLTEVPKLHRQLADIGLVPTQHSTLSTAREHFPLSIYHRKVSV